MRLIRWQALLIQPRAAGRVVIGDREWIERERRVKTGDVRVMNGDVRARGVATEHQLPGVNGALPRSSNIKVMAG